LHEIDREINDWRRTPGEAGLPAPDAAEHFAAIGYNAASSKK
jgi:hypothetical protein